jgi:hypothetical protein
MKQKGLEFKISIGETFIQDVENGIVNFGMASQRKITKNIQGNPKDVRPTDLNKGNFRVSEHG